MLCVCGFRGTDVTRRIVSVAIGARRSFRPRLSGRPHQSLRSGGLEPPVISTDGDVRRFGQCPSPDGRDFRGFPIGHGLSRDHRDGPPPTSTAARRRRPINHRLSYSRADADAERLQRIAVGVWDRDECDVDTDDVVGMPGHQGRDDLIERWPDIRHERRRACGEKCPGVVNEDVVRQVRLIDRLERGQQRSDVAVAEVTTAGVGIQPKEAGCCQCRHQRRE